MEKIKVSFVIIPELYKKAMTSVLDNNNLERSLILDGKGTADKLLLQTLGLGQVSKSVFILLYKECEQDTLYNSIENLANSSEDLKGIFFTFQTETDMAENDKNLVIFTIVNAGYAEDIMKEARKAGAKGGTILTGKGTSTNSDLDFFGINITPEKEVLIMLAEKELAHTLVDTIKSMPLVQKAGSGIVFTVQTESYMRLGGKQIV